ncbi:MAG: efflux RND transporter periplasmic adaptor subunit, partial [Thermoguttaceae bacterium]
MTNDHPDEQHVLGPEGAEPSAPKTRLRGLWERVFPAVQLALTLAVVGGVLFYLLFAGKGSSAPDEEKRPSRPEEVVSIAGPSAIRVRPGTPLDDKLRVTTVNAVWLTSPVLPVTGAALASLRPGKELTQDAWQFATPDLLTAFADWQKAVTDIQFQESQLKAIRDLSESRIDAQQEVVTRMEKLVAAGTDTQKDLVAERTNLIQYRIQGRKEIHEAETTVKLARRTEATLARQLQQAGLEPTMLRSAAAEGDIVVAEVPERLMDRVKLDMTCEVRFYALPNRVFTGKVSGISPVISKDKRVLNVQFVVKDAENAVRPGMFAQIGLGTDKRQAKLMPADGVLHVGDADYALLGREPETWHIVEVQVGELRGTDVEVRSGLKAGDRVLGQGAILLKPVVVRCLQSAGSPPDKPAGAPV